jgi:hypothetical protein
VVSLLRRKTGKKWSLLEMDEKSFSWLQEATVKGRGNWRDRGMEWPTGLSKVATLCLTTSIERQRSRGG